MNVINTRLRVADDGTVSGHVSGDVPAGEHEATIIVATPPRKPDAAFDIDRLPVIDLGQWPTELPLRRENLYGDDGR